MTLCWEVQVKRIVWRMLGRLGVGLLVVLAAGLAVGKLAGFGCANWGHKLPTGDGQRAVAELLEGSWLGTWASSQSQMKGELRCRIEKLQSGAYLAHFDAVFAKYLRNESTVTLKVQRGDAAWQFTGEEDLGLMKGGVCKYDGRSDGNEFVCSYDSQYDKGTFRMKRLGPATAPSGGYPGR
jgi:hypothetical protein